MSAFSALLTGSGLSPFLKSFGRREAYESRRRTNPRDAVIGLWGFRLTVVLEWVMSAAGRRRVLPETPWMSLGHRCQGRRWMQDDAARKGEFGDWHVEARALKRGFRGLR